jgi:hypothetical protein
MNDYTPDRELNPPEESVPETDDPMLDYKIDELLDKMI